MVGEEGNTHIDAGQHGEPPEADGGEGQGDKDPNPKADGQKLTTLPLWSKLSPVYLWVSVYCVVSGRESHEQKDFL